MLATSKARAGSARAFFAPLAPSSRELSAELTEGVAAEAG